MTLCVLCVYVCVCVSAECNPPNSYVVSTIEFNISKCHVMKMGKSKYRPYREYKLGEETVKEVNEEKDLGVIIQNNLCETLQ